MRLQGTRFGTIEFDPADILTLEDGLVGFEGLTRFLLVCAKPESAFRWLQSVESPDTAFLLAEPLHFFPTYGPTLDVADCESLDIGQDTPRFVLVTAAIPRGKPEEMTLNLRAPVVLNMENRRGKQVILEDEAYTYRHRVLQAVREEATETVAA